MSISLNQRGISMVDITLIIVIVLSVGIIGYRFIAQGHQTKSATNLSAEALKQTTKLETIAATPAPSSLPLTDDDEWKKLTADPIMHASRVQTADGCPAAYNQKMRAFWTSNPERLQQIQAKQPQVFWALKEFLCLSVGQKLPLYTFGKDPAKPLVSYLTTMTVTDIISIEIRKIPAAYLASQSSSVEKLEQYLAPKRALGPGARDNIIRLKNAVSEPPPPAVAPPVAAYAKIIYKENRKAFLEKFPKATIVDVRSPEEFAKGSFPHAINIPFTPAPMKSNAFSFAVKNQDLANSNFDINLVLSKMTPQGLVIVGGPPSDGRAFWATQFLSNLTKGDFYYFYDGI